MSCWLLLMLLVVDIQQHTTCEVYPTDATKATENVRTGGTFLRTASARSVPDPVDRLAGDVPLRMIIANNQMTTEHLRRTATHEFTLCPDQLGVVREADRQSRG